MKSTASCINWKFTLATSKVGILTQILKKDTEVLINLDHDGVYKKGYSTWIKSRKFIVIVNSWSLINSSPMLVEIKGGIGDVGRVVLDNVMEEGVAELFLFAHQLGQVNDQDGGVQSELLIQVSAEGFVGLLVSWRAKKKTYM